MLVSKVTSYTLVQPFEVEVSDPGITGDADTILGNLTSTASGVHITGSASNTLEALTSTTAGTAYRPGFRQSIGLMGTLRPVKSLHATWVPR